MNATAVIVIAVAAVVVLGAIAFVTLARRSRRARRRRCSARDPSARPRRARRAPGRRAASPRTRPRPRPRARSPAPARRSCRSTDRRRSAPWVPPDPEALGVSRRQFFNRATVIADGAGIGAFAAASFVAFLWPSPDRRLRRQGPRRQARRHHGRHPRPAAASSTRPRPAPGSPPIRPTRAKAKAVYAGASSPGMEQGLVALYQKCPHLGCRVP